MVNLSTGSAVHRCATVTYDAPLRKYLMCVTDGWPTVARMNSYVLESDRITGPWRLVVYMKAFGEQAYFLNFPSKFIGKDGRSLWLCCSANFSAGWNGVDLRVDPVGGRYGLCLQEVRLLAPGEKPEAPKSDLDGADNVAPSAKVETSSTHGGYRAGGVVDRVAGGYPGDVSKEWASAGETVGARLRLTWSAPQTARRILLVDRPNLLDQVTGGRIEFSDGSSIVLAKPLPDDGSKALEVTFERKTIRWLELTVTAVKAGSPNIGLSEIAVFR